MSHETAKRGRKAKPYVCPWDGKTIDGLYRKPDGRWRIIGTNIEWREADERAAVAKFRQWQQTQDGRTLFLSLSQSIDPTETADAAERLSQDRTSNLLVIEHDDDSYELGYAVDEKVFWAEVRKQLLKRPEYAAEATGLPQLANFADMPLPRGSISLKTLLQEYRDHAEVQDITRRKTKTAWEDFVDTIQVSTLREVTTEKLLAYRDAVRARGYAPDSEKWLYGCIKKVISFGRKRGLDANEIRSALDRAAVLIAPKGTNEFKPHPISQKHFAKLLKVADDLDRALLLTALNCCMYVSEVLALDWDDVDLEAGTVLTDRQKTGCIRVAVLWQRTIEALRKIRRPAGAIFRSSRGGRYHPNSYRKVFASLRTEAKLPKEVEFNHIRDGAYTAGCAAGVEFHLVKIIAGHRQSGESDAYIARNPKMVAPVCQAIEKAYFTTRKIGAKAAPGQSR